MFTTYLEDRREQRETTYIYRTLIRYMKIQTAAVEHYSTRVLNGSRTQKWETELLRRCHYQGLTKVYCCIFIPRLGHFLSSLSLKIAIVVGEVS